MSLRCCGQLDIQVAWEGRTAPPLRLRLCHVAAISELAVPRPATGATNFAGPHHCNNHGMSVKERIVHRISTAKLLSSGYDVSRPPLMGSGRCRRVECHRRAAHV